MEDVEEYRDPELSEAEKAALVVSGGMALDDAIINFERKKSEGTTADRFSRRAVALAAKPFSSPFSGVLGAAQTYLSPLRGEEEHHWYYFIVNATDIITKHASGEDDSAAAKINANLYNILGDKIMTINNYPYRGQDIPEPGVV